jgi:hypothetical protein
MRIFIRPLTPIQQEIANALETKASETKMKRGLVPIQEGRPGLRQNRKRRILFTPS